MYYLFVGYQNKGGKKMRNARATLLSAICLVGILLLIGCASAKSYTFDYQASTALSPNAAALQKITIGIAKFEDKRAWVEKENLESESYVGHAGKIKTGLTYKKNDFTPVKDIFQDLLIQELTKAGFKARALDKVFSKDNLSSIKDFCKDQAADYILGGQLLVFEFVNKPAIWTITSDKTVTVKLNLFKCDDAQMLIDTAIHETESQEYPMGVAISVNVNNLINDVFRKVAQQIVQKTDARITGLQLQKNK
jgi:hypothetical protein